MPLPYFSTCRHLVVTHVGAEFGRAVSPYASTCRFVIVPRVVFLFVNVSFFHTAMCAFLVGTRGVDVANFCSASLSPRGSNSSHIPIGPRVLSTCRVRFIRVRSILDHLSVSYWITHPFPILENARFGPPRVRIHYMSTFIQIHFITELMKQHYYSEKLALLF